MISGILSSGWGKNIYMENMDEAFFGDIVSVFDQIHINFTKTILYKDIECLLLEEGVNNCKNKTIIVMRYKIHVEFYVEKMLCINFISVYWKN